MYLVTFHSCHQQQSQSLRTGLVLTVCVCACVCVCVCVCRGGSVCGASCTEKVPVRSPDWSSLSVKMEEVLRRVTEFCANIKKTRR